MSAALVGGNLFVLPGHIHKLMALTGRTQMKQPLNILFVVLKKKKKKIDDTFYEVIMADRVIRKYD